MKTQSICRGDVPGDETVYHDHSFVYDDAILQRRRLSGESAVSDEGIFYDDVVYAHGNVSCDGAYSVVLSMTAAAF